MPKKMLIDATHAEETRVVVVDGNKVEEFDFESAARRQLAGNIYLAKVTRVEPSLQAAFVDYGGNRHGFLAFAEIHPDYYQIPIADREALLAEEKAYAESLAAETDEDEQKSGSKPRTRRRTRSRPKAAEAVADPVATTDIEGMETVDLETAETDLAADAFEGSSPMELVGETPVDTPAADEADSQETDDTDEATDPPAADAGGRKNRRRGGSRATGSTETDAPPTSDAAPDGKPDEDVTIESVADEDDSDDVRPVPKPRPRRFKIQEVVKVRQVMLVQVVKEERGNKGAALTTYLSLAGATVS